MDKILLIINSTACGLIALRLLCFHRNGAGHRPFVACIAWLIIVASASVPIRVLFNGYIDHDASEAVLNSLLCIAVFTVKGNVSQLIWLLRRRLEA